MLSHSLATLHDETGLRPHFYNASAGATNREWSTDYYGSFRTRAAVSPLSPFHASIDRRVARASGEFENRETTWYPGEKAELQRRFTGAELPFQFGYAQSGGHGVLQTAWRKETA